jgi:EAL domain-containing protein (putative c-di-GMP-specific phosphodiesterase class I)
VYCFALHPTDYPGTTLPLTAENHREYAMDEPVRVFVAGCPGDDRYSERQILTDSEIDFNPQCGDAQQWEDSSLRLEQDLAEALRLRALRVEYQPQFDLGDGHGCGVEALARWTRFTGETIAPSVFILLAERTGMIHALGAWMLQSACATASYWSRNVTQPTTLSVNVSAVQINEGFSTIIERALKKSGFPARQLELEITESALMANPALSIECLQAWKRLGVRIAMDDFGTGYSSLSSLSKLPVDRLKLDRSLVHQMTLDRKGAAIVRLIVSLGTELDMEVIAEGVETEDQLKMLTDMGCPQAQGYLLGRPTTAEQVQVALSKAWGNRPMPLSGGSSESARKARRANRSAALSKRFTMSTYDFMATQRLRTGA